ncbi:MAG: hypothetical protein OXF74_03165 [Rhodobacteraceae bacterium]|nr:hypothetical protein [Paracoccaceae bacterium]
MEYGFNLGSFSRKITTSSTEAQSWFDRGLAWCYGFNHEEAAACFERAAAADSACAMAYWGLAYATGPNYNKVWDAFDEREAAAAVATAHKAAVSAAGLTESCTEAEKRLITAIGKRFPEDRMHPAHGDWEQSYAVAMRGVYAHHPEDPDVAALFADALMMLSPWELWDVATGEVPEGAHTVEARAVLESALERIERRGQHDHPGLLHMYIHLMEMSQTPEAALTAADKLRNLIPDAGHLQHMPTHIDVLCGDYSRVVSSNHDAVVADRLFLEREGALKFYTLYRCHNNHFKVYGAMFLGCRKTALEAADELTSTLPEELLRVESPPMADWVEAFVPVRQHVLVRFGMWEELLAQELPGDSGLYCVTTTTMRYARSVAMAASGRVDAAEAEAEKFESAYATIPESRCLFNNSCRDILAVARKMMQGEIAYRKGDFEQAFALLSEAVKLDDDLPYDEPWGWMQPVRHALGALLLEQNRPQEALPVYEADLGLNNQLRRACQHPDNVWSLCGYLECLVRLDMQELIPVARQRFKLAAARADVPVKASCFCRLETA